MKIIKLISAILLPFIILAFFAGCGGKDYEPVELVPEGSELVGSMKVGEVLLTIKLYSELDGNEEVTGWMESTKEEFHENTGMDLDDISEVVMFAVPGDSDSLEEMEYAGIILKGNFSDGNLIRDIEEANEVDFTEGKYNGYTLYTDRSKGGAVVKVSNSMMISGTENAVKDCLDVMEGNLETAGGVLMDNYNALGAVMMKLSMLVPESATESFTAHEEVMMPVGLQAFADIDTLSMAGDMGVTGLEIRAKVGFTGSESAAEAADSLKTIFQFFSIMSTDEESAEILERIEITSSASTMDLSYEMTLGELLDMVEKMESGEGFPMDPSMIPGLESEGGIAIPPSHSGK